ncbi:hypothetical protein PGT21_029266 [Puccinia graminis f. sp. tritici]|uniref:Uncharacterized protein n=1 Tax=Puccinia graminis f. sp. tritici TaxID=56615 RepID=A0A5B0QQ17_PUCGR|nr:hypothetical protein PGT21_029266 [Puccinia graminis f. sp. tritici]
MRPSMSIFLEYYRIVLVALCFFQATQSIPPFPHGIGKHADAEDFDSSFIALKMFGSSEGMGWTTNKIPNLEGRVAIVTGANSGIGYFTALELARHGAKTYLACRNPGLAEEAINKIRAIVPGSDLRFLKLDITSLNSAHSAAQEFIKSEERLDILVNNAAIAFKPYELSEDGIELQLCNAIGHFAFTIPLLDLLKKTSKDPESHVRIVNVSSVAHSWVLGTPDFSSVENLNKHSYCPIDRYGLSKLMNILFTNELQRRLSNTNVICASTYPGGVNTKLIAGISVKNYPILKNLGWLTSRTLLTPKDGAITSLYAATALEVEEKGLRSAYFCPFGVAAKPSKLAQDRDLAKKFWELCEKLVKEKVKSLSPAHLKISIHPGK